MTCVRGVAVVSAIAAAAWTIFAGKDLSWDLLHYHYYVAHAFLHGRLTQDFFAASAQSYLNPLGYIPFYALAASGLHSVAVSVAFAVVHSVNAVLLYAIARRLFEDRAPREREWFAALAAALGVASAVFWATVGTSFLDPLLTVPMLGGLLLLLRTNAPGTSARAAFAGFLFGAAAALKYSNALFALAAVALPWMQGPAGARTRVRGAAAYAAGCLAAILLFGGYTFLFLWREFGNPVFPLFNGWFRSPEFPPINIGAERFAPRSLGDAVLFPFRAVSPESMVYAEISAPDFRFAALMVLAAGLAAVLVWRRGRAMASGGRAPSAADWRLIVFFALAYSLWLATSSNGRYGMLVVLLAGLLAARLAGLLLAPAVARGALLVLLVSQIVACALISPSRWFMLDRWSTRWLAYEVPARAAREPALYLTVETQTMAAVVPFLHPDSAFVNVRGQHSIGRGAERMQALFARYAGRVRALGRALRLRRDGRPRPEIVENYDATLLRYGFKVDPEDCFAIPWRPRRDDAVSELANMLVTDDTALRPPPVGLVSCALRPGAWSPAEIEEERRMSALFDRMERDCPGVFRGQTSITERFGREWSRSYAGLEARLETREGALVLAPYFKLIYFPLGRIEDWRDGAPASLAAVCREGLRQ